MPRARLWSLPSLRDEVSDLSCGANDGADMSTADDVLVFAKDALAAEIRAALDVLGPSSMTPAEVAALAGVLRPIYERWQAAQQQPRAPLTLVPRIPTTKGTRR